ncbi:hypothetical protein MJO52_14225 [Microbulbifer variabilis]|uniref:Lipoprotein n=1 Tax=Microbulbifer variabilis TaxID=266805 RepID=A0ABY4V7I0_9GAMM|nr:hypothetical protein [Microbulbifer variabilis]USD20227.1 hypothetical protein MJO52_14225 [Microbulbifer variabilis]
MTRFFIISLLAILTSSVYADSLGKQLKHCSKVTSNTDRLACYDKLSNSIERRAEQNFGQEYKQTVETPESIEARITEIQESTHNKKIVTLENGQIWKQNDTGRIFWKAGDLIIVERAMFGSFFMKPANGGKKMRVKRLK